MEGGGLIRVRSPRLLGCSSPPGVTGSIVLLVVASTVYGLRQFDACLSLKPRDFSSWVLSSDSDGFPKATCGATAARVQVAG
jgi:hypothetical protein